MNMTAESTTAPKWFKIIAITALIWNLLGVMAYIMQVTMSPEALAALPEAERLLYETVPSWATGAFAISVFGGTLGCIALFAKKASAFPLFIISLIGILTQMYHSFFMSNSFEVFGPGGAIMPVMVIVVAIYLIWLSQSAKSKGWIS
jgi:hypothetical protein